MLPHLSYALSFLPPTDAERAEMAHLYPHTDARWHQKMDRARVVVTVRDAAQLVAVGIVHDSIVAPTELMDAVELGCMIVDPRYRRMGIRQHVTSLRLEHALRMNANPITVIYAGNPASWAFYERSQLWMLEREYEFNEQRLFIYQSTDVAREWVRQLPHAAELAQDPRKAGLLEPIRAQFAHVQPPKLEATPLGVPHPVVRVEHDGFPAGHGMEQVSS